jgi:hypothetical protein
VGENTTGVASRTPVALPPIAITLSDTGLEVAPFGVRVSVAHSQRAVVFATLQAVLAEGLPAPPQGHAPTDRLVEIELVPTSGAADSASTRSAADLAPTSAPWMAEALNRIATDPALADAIGRSVGVDAVDVVAAPWRVVLADARRVPVILAATRARERDARQLVLLTHLSASAPVTPLLFRAVLGALAGPDGLAEAEVRTIPDTTLAAWTRPAAQPSAEALGHVEDSDRQWLWTAVLAALLVETWMRRDRSTARSGPKSVETHEHAA